MNVQKPSSVSIKPTTGFKPLWNWPNPRWVMKPRLRVIATVFAAAAFAVALSVGAAFAEDHQPVAAKGASGKPPAGVCILHDLGLKD